MSQPGGATEEGTAGYRQVERGDAAASAAVQQQDGRPFAAFARFDLAYEDLYAGIAGYPEIFTMDRLRIGNFGNEYG